MDVLQRIKRFLLGEPIPTDDPSVVTSWERLSEWTTAQQSVVLGLCGLVLAVTAWNLWRTKRRRRAKLALFTLRLGMLGLLLFMFYQPALVEERRARSTNTIVVLVDDSASMAIPHEGSTRRDLAASFVREHQALFEAYEKTNAVEAFRAGDGLQSTDWRKLDKELTAQGKHSRWIETLEEVRDRFRNRDIGGVVLVSDGIDNGRGGRILAQGNDLDHETQALLKSLNAPVYTFGLSGSTVKDVGIKELRYSPFAFKRNVASLEAVISVNGYDSGTVEVDLLEEGAIVRSVVEDLRPDRKRFTVAFDFTPETIGFRVYSVRVKPLNGEVTTENNERHAVIRVNRDKIRVLQIAGHPSWDVRYLRNHLKRTPNVQLISFFILINTGMSMSNVQANETALIPFPAEELFVKELGGFDLVVLQDFNYGPFSTPQHLHRVRDFVKNGGAMVMVGGRLSLGAGGYEGTEIGEVLPVGIAPPEFNDDAIDTGEFTPSLTETGRTHPVTQLSFDDAENVKLWETLPKMEGLNKTTGLANGGLALVRHPRLRGTDGQGMPVVAVNEPGKGRAAVVATDSVWRWKLTNAGRGGDDQVYDRFWQSLIRWLIKDPDLDLVRVTPSQGVRALGESVELEVRVFTPDYRPSPNHGFTLSIKRRPTLVASGDQAKVVLEKGDLHTDDNGRFAMTHEPTDPGIYDVEAKATVAGRQLVAHTVFVVADERPEMRDVVGDGRLLESLSRATGGAAYTLLDRNVPMHMNPPRVSDVTSRRYHERWNLPAVFFGICVIFGLEWWLRRRWGFL